MENLGNGSIRKRYTSYNWGIQTTVIVTITGLLTGA